MHSFAQWTHLQNPKLNSESTSAILSRSCLLARSTTLLLSLPPSCSCNVPTYLLPTTFSLFPSPLYLHPSISPPSLLLSLRASLPHSHPIPLCLCVMSCCLWLLLLSFSLTDLFSMPTWIWLGPLQVSLRKYLFFFTAMICFTDWMTFLTPNQQHQSSVG